MKLFELRPPRERFMHSTSAVRRRANPGPQPALSVTVESPARTMRILALLVVAGPAPAGAQQIPKTRMEDRRWRMDKVVFRHPPSSILHLRFVIRSIINLPRVR